MSLLESCLQTVSPSISDSGAVSSSMMNCRVREVAEIQAVLSVTQPHRYGDSPQLCKYPGELRQQSGLASACVGDDHTRAPGSAVPQVVDDHLAQPVPADHLTGTPPKVRCGLSAPCGGANAPAIAAAGTPHIPT